MPRAAGQGPCNDIGQDGRNRTAAEGTPGLGIEPPYLAQHVENVLFVDFANLAQCREIAFREQIQMADEHLHGWVEPVALAQLDGEAFGEIAGADAGGFESLDEVEDAFGLFQRRTETCGDFFERTGGIAVLVDESINTCPVSRSAGPAAVSPN